MEEQQEMTRTGIEEDPWGYTYMMLSRLQSDNDYFLGAGGRNPEALWAKDVENQIAKMRELYDGLPDDKKPEWLTSEQIDGYAEKMAPASPAQEAARPIPYEDLTKEQRALVDSEDWQDRLEAARDALALDRLADDPEAIVRRAVAGQGYALDRLADDPEELVREAVAFQGHALDKLADDPATIVRLATEYALEEQGVTLEQWAEQNPDKCALPENRPSEPAAPDPFRELAPEEAAMVGSPYPEVRREAAEAGLGIWTLLGDDDRSVRLAAAKAAAKGIDADGIGADAVEDESGHIIIAFDTMKERSGLSEHEISIDYDLDAGRFSGDAVEHGGWRELSSEEVARIISERGLDREVAYGLGRMDAIADAPAPQAPGIAIPEQKTQGDMRTSLREDASRPVASPIAPDAERTLRQVV